jgi:hypothetical protein
VRYLTVLVLLALTSCANAPTIETKYIEVPGPAAAVLESTDALCITHPTRHGMSWYCIHRDGRKYEMITGDV